MKPNGDRNKIPRALSSSSYFIFAVSSLIFLIIAGLGCSKIVLDSLRERYLENFGGALVDQGPITIGTPTAFTFAIFADTHIGNPGGETMKTIVSQSVASGDAFVVVAGDLTDNGDIGQYQQFKSVMAQNGATFRTTLGNHDVFFNGWDNYKQILGRSMYSFDAGSVHFSMLDSANGVLGRDQLNWLEQDLQGTNKTFKVVVSHFPPWNGYFSSMFKMSSDEEAAIFKDMLNRNRVNLMIAGHYHGYDEAQLGFTKYIVTGGANNIIDPGQRKHFVRVTVAGSSITTEIVYLP